MPPSSASALGFVDRTAAERTDEDLLDRVRADERTRVVQVRADRTLLTADGAVASVAPHAVTDDAEWAFLGRTADGTAVLVASLDADADGETDPEAWRALREIGGELSPNDTATLVTAVAVGRWLRDSSFCPACGARAVLRTAGWSRSCPSCGREHFPRTDPAVIVAVARADDPDRLLLGSNALWGVDRYSCFAGFAEAGETLEDAVVREVHEEAGVHVGDVRYVGSQGWPYPRSLMLGFSAVALDPDEARGDGEEIADARWFTRAEIGAGLEGAGSLILPGRVSIAHRLIRAWYEGGV